VARKFHDITLDTCPKCAGIFFDEGEITALRQEGTEALTEVEDAVRPTIDVLPIAEASRSCPSCGTDMDKYHYLYTSPVVLDSCHNCGGVWVQDGELQRMRDVLDSERASYAKRPSGFATTPSNPVHIDQDVSRAKRLERVMRLLHRKAYY